VKARGYRHKSLRMGRRTFCYGNQTAGAKCKSCKWDNGRLGEIPDQSVSADSFQGSGTGRNGTFQSFLSELIPINSHYFIKTSINYTIKRLKTIIQPL
jgi:hypothetical protein